MAVMAILIQADFQFRQPRRQDLHLLLKLGLVGLVGQQLRPQIRLRRQQLPNPGHDCIRPGLINRQDFVP